VTRLEAWRSSSCITLMSALVALNSEEYVWRLCRMRHSRHYAEFRNMPNDRAMAAA
jgi:hypothetical protein